MKRLKNSFELKQREEKLQFALAGFSIFVLAGLFVMFVCLLRQSS